MTALLQVDQWNEAIRQLPGTHILQTWEWGQFKSRYGWQPFPQLWHDEQGVVKAAALVLKRAVPGGWSVLYSPRGPLVDWDDPVWAGRVLDDLCKLAKQHRAIFIKVDPELILAWGAPETETERANPAGEHILSMLREKGWQLSPDQIQFRNTVWLDLDGSEEDWLARMKQKTRYNLRLARKKGVQIRTGSLQDIPLLYRMYAETSVRDGFVIRSEAYYQDAWRSFMEKGLAEALIAEVDGDAVAGLLLFSFAGRAWYLYGMSTQAHRDKMPNYLLQWEAMRAARARGCSLYDLWGAPDVFDETDSMWGVFRFKEGLGATVVRTAGAWDYSARPLLYALYTRILPRLLDFMRQRGKARTRQAVSL